MTSGDTTQIVCNECLKRELALKLALDMIKKANDTQNVIENIGLCKDVEMLLDGALKGFGND